MFDIASPILPGAGPPRRHGPWRQGRRPATEARADPAGRRCRLDRRADRAQRRRRDFDRLPDEAALRGGGLERALNEAPRPGAERKLDASDESLLVAVACSKPPAG